MTGRRRSSRNGSRSPPAPCGATSVGLAGVDDAALRALAKLDQVMPQRLVHRARTIAGAVSTPPARGPQLDPEVLTSVAAAVRDHRTLRVDYRDHAGETTRRTLEPQRIVHTGTRWYLLAWDVERDAWRNHRLDRLTPRIPVGPAFSPRPDPQPDAVSFVLRGVQSNVYRYRCVVTVAAPAAVVVEAFGVLAADVEPVDAGHCLVRSGAHDLTVAALRFLALDADLAVHEPPELRDALAAIGERIARIG